VTPEWLLASGSSGQPLQRSTQTRGFLGADLFDEVAEHQFGAPGVEHLAHELGTVLLGVNVGQYR
jgi:hypothetical protein